MDIQALETKLQQSKQLFYLLDGCQEGYIHLDDLIFELKAGGLAPEHVDIVIEKFAEDGTVRGVCGRRGVWFSS